MNVSEVVERVRNTCLAVVEGRGLELVELTLAREPGGRVLRVTVERPDGPLTLDDIAETSDEISTALDADDPIDVAYTLEVASPGLERPLTKPSDYERFQSSAIRVKCHEPIEGRRKFQGTILRSSDETFVLDTETGVVEIPYTSVARANLVVDWDAELRRKS